MVEYLYDTWGKLLSVSGSLSTTLGYDQPFRYRGYVYDNDTGWYYLQSRYYDPNTCRFISADVLLSTGQGVLGHNAFAYCGNNPVNYSDVFGYTQVPTITMMQGRIIHRLIQADVKAKHIGGYTWHSEVIVNRNRNGKGVWGSVDLVDSSGGIYEIKRRNSLSRPDPETQLNNYKKAGLKYPKDYPGIDKLHIGTVVFSGWVGFEDFIITYSCEGNGVIWYDVEKRQYSNATVPVFEEEFAGSPVGIRIPVLDNRFVIPAFVSMGCIMVGGGIALNSCFYAFR